MTTASHDAHKSEDPSSTKAPHGRHRSPVRRGPVLLATDGMGASNATAIVARLIAERLERPLGVVTVLEPMMSYASAMDIPAIMPATVEPQVRAAREETVRRYVIGALSQSAQWKLDVRYGPTSYELATAAREMDASIVVIGSAPHQRRGRTVSGVRAAQVLRNVRCPVLSVAHGLFALPRQAVAAIDFSTSSIRAARDALLLLGEGGTLTLVHIAPISSVDQPLRHASGDLIGGNAAGVLGRLRERLLRWAPSGVAIETRMGAGNVTDEVLSSAEDLQADLVVVGTHGPNFVERLFVGSVATSLLHLAPCSVLASPPPDAAERVELDLESWSNGATSDAAAWGVVLDAFTERNSGRAVRIEVDDPAFGAQVQATGHVLMGTTYDAKDRRVEVMLSIPTETRSHLTRTIPGVDSIAITRGADGRDRAMQIRHGTGETLLIFEHQA